MKRKFIVLMLAAILAFSMTAFAAENDETADLQTEEETAVSSEISGYYIVNYANASDKVNLSIIAEPDLIAAAQEADSVIYFFGDDGSVIVYKGGEAAKGSFSAEDGRLNIETDAGSEEYDYEIIDGLLILRSADESMVLYDFTLSDMEYITIDDYSVIEINETSVTVTDDDVNNYINTVVQGQTTYEQVTEGVTEEGDIVTISFEGVLEGEEEPFEGGTADSITLQLGSGALIADYEEQLTGQEIGSTIEVEVTFPDDYSNIEGLAGKNAVFTTTILYKTVSHTPEFTDEWVQEFSEGYLPEKLDTTEQFTEFARQYLEDYVMGNAIVSALAAKTRISAYNSNVLQLLVNYSASNLSYAASLYGYDMDSYAQLYGYDSADAFEQAEALSNANVSMIVNKVMTDEGITYTLEDLNKALEEYMRMSGYGDIYTLEEYKEQTGTAGMWIYTNLEYKFGLVTEALKDRVILVSGDAQEETQENTQE